MTSAVRVHTPVVQAHREVVQPGVATGEVEVENAGEPFAIEHHVVAKEVSVDRSARQCCVVIRRGNAGLTVHLAREQGTLVFIEVRPHQRNGLRPPAKSARVGLMLVVVLAGQMHARQHRPNGGAVSDGGIQLALATQPVDHHRGLVLQPMQDASLVIRHGVGHRDPVVGKVLHQVQVEGQLVHRQPLEQRQHIRASSCFHEVVGVLDAARAGFDDLQVAEIKRAQEGGGFVERDFGIDSHGCSVQ